jgi:hypothetical protein
MDVSQLIDALKRRGHTIGQSAISPTGLVLLNVDWKLMTMDEVRELLSKETKRSDTATQSKDEQ